MITLDVTSFYASGAGGIRSYYQAKARWLPTLGVECHFAVPGARAGVERLGGGWLHRVPGPPLGAHYRAFGDVAALWRVIDDVAPDVIELGSHYLLPQLLAPALRRRRPAVVGFYHADYPTTYVAPACARLPRALGRAAAGAAWSLVRAQHRRYHATLTGSHAMTRALVTRGVPRVRWVGLGVDPDRFAGDPGRAPRGRIGFLGRLAPDKEVALLLAAAPAITRSTGAVVAIAGEGPLAPAVHAAAARGEVEAVGLVAADAVPAFLASLDALVVPSRYESFGLAAAEALAAGTPIVTADQGGAAELAQRSGAGVTFAAGSSAALAAAVIALVREPAPARRARAQAGRALIDRELTWPRVCARIHDAYRACAPC